MKTILLTILILNSFLQMAYTQSQMQMTIGGTGTDNASSLIQTSDGGYAVAGTTNSFGAGLNDMYIIKFNSSGTLQWNKTVGGTSNDNASSIIQTFDGGFVIAGSTASFGAGGNDFYIIKLDAGGALLWSKTIGGTGSETAYSIIQTSEGGYAVAGSTASFGAGGNDFFLVKLDVSGTLLWSKTFGGGSSDIASSIIQTTDGGYALTGANWLQGGNYILKLDSGGNLQWIKTVYEVYGGPGYSILQTTDGGYVFTGSVHTFGAGGYDFFIEKIDAGGNYQWSKTFGSTIHEQPTSLIQTADGGYVVAGSSFSLSFTSYDYYIVKLGSSGNFEWNKSIGGTGNDRPSSIIQTSNNGYLIAGNSNSFGSSGIDIYIVKLDASGNSCSNTLSPSSSSGTGGTLGDLTFTGNSPAPMVNSPSSVVGSYGTVTAICSFVGIQPISNERPNSFSLSQNYPNPFNPSTKIKFALPNTGFAKLVVYDALGKVVETLVNEQLNAGTYEAVWSGEKYSTGVYYYKLISGEISLTNKMVLIK